MEAQTTQQNLLPRINGMTRDFKVMSTYGEIPLSQFTQAGKRNSSPTRLARAAILGLAIFVCMASAVRAADLWDDNDYIISAIITSGNALVVLDENFNVKGLTRNCQTLCGSTFGNVDWLTNGDVILADSLLSFDSLKVFRFNRQGEQLTYATGDIFPYGINDIKVSFNDDVIVGAFGRVKRYTWDFTPGTFYSGLSGFEEFDSTFLTGGVAVVPRADGTHELWVAADADFEGIRIFPMTASGQVQFDQGIAANPAVPAASASMTYDPATRRVLFYNSVDPVSSRLSNGKILAMDVETRAVVRTYAIPADQLPVGGVAFTGITPGPNGIIVAVESYAHFIVPLSPRRIGLSVWDADGSNYRFIRNFSITSGKQIVIHPRTAHYHRAKEERGNSGRLYREEPGQ